MNRNKIILVGGGGHCRSVIDVIEQENKFEITGIVDVKEKYNTEVSGYKILWHDAELADLVSHGYSFCVTLGQIKSAASRINIYNNLKKLNAYLPVIVSPFAHVSKLTSIKEGTVIMHHALINSGVNIGINCIINTKSLLEHDVVIGDHCHVSTAAVLNGDVNLGNGVFVGSNSVINNNIKIAGKTIIGSGSSVIADISKPGIYAGNPARQLQQ